MIPDALQIIGATLNVSHVSPPLLTLCGGSLAQIDRMKGDPAAVPFGQGFPARNSGIGHDFE